METDEDHKRKWEEKLEEAEKEDRKEFREIRNSNFRLLEENRQHMSRSIDHWILTASLGSFAIFLAFLQKISFTPLLAALAIADWIIFIVTSFIVLKTMKLAKEASTYAQNVMDAHKL